MASGADHSHWVQHHLSRSAIALTVAGGAFTAVLAMLRLLGAIACSWAWVAAPAIIAIALWLAAALIIVITLWLMVRIGKDIP
jgi:protein-S-isoprenylcysteine O-methyltransferase Ste14